MAANLGEVMAHALVLTISRIGCPSSPARRSRQPPSQGCLSMRSQCIEGGNLPFPGGVSSVRLRSGVAPSWAFPSGALGGHRVLALLGPSFGSPWMRWGGQALRGILTFTSSSRPGPGGARHSSRVPPRRGRSAVRPAAQAPARRRSGAARATFPVLARVTSTVVLKSLGRPMKVSSVCLVYAER